MASVLPEHSKLLVAMKKKKKKQQVKRSMEKAFPYMDPATYRLLRLNLPSDHGNPIAQPDDLLRRLGSPLPFSVETLCAAIQNKCTVESIKWYLQSYQHFTTFNSSISTNGWPALYYAAERNVGDLMSILFQHDVDQNFLQSWVFIPPLAYVIIYGYLEAVDTSEMVKLLLAGGAKPTIIPMDMWIRYLESPLETPKLVVATSDAAREASAWCTPSHRFILAKSLYLTHRYLLDWAHTLTPWLPRMFQSAEANKMTQLSKLPYFLVGQRPAVNLIMKQVYSHISLGSRTTLIVAFAGASVTDCAGCHDVWALFGSTAGWNRNDDGSKLNNFLAANSGKRSVVFLNEFDKTNQKMRDALLLVTQGGEYEDRRFNTAVDCKQTIWIIATNFGDDHIAKYYTKNIEKLDERNRNTVDLMILQASLKQEYRNKFGAAFTGRINCVIPFLPFSPSECAVVLHKFMLQFATSIRQPIDLNPGVQRLVGHCRLSLVEDGQICINLTERFYNKDLGARSLANAVKEVEGELSAEYSNVDELITEDINKGPLQSFFVRRIPIADDVYEVRVFAGGIVELEGRDGVPVVEEKEEELDHDVVNRPGHNSDLEKNKYQYDPSSW